MNSPNGPRRREVFEQVAGWIDEVNEELAPHSLMTLAEFFEGNDDPETIGYNLPDPPEPREFYELFSQILARPEVIDVRVEAEYLDPEDGRPDTDTIWIFTSAVVDTVSSWFPQRLAPDDWIAPEDRSIPVDTSGLPHDVSALCAFYD